MAVSGDVKDFIPRDGVHGEEGGRCRGWRAVTLRTFIYHPESKGCLICLDKVLFLPVVPGPPISCPGPEGRGPLPQSHALPPRGSHTACRLARQNARRTEPGCVVRSCLPEPGTVRSVKV